jgi:hypothetical protein
MTRQRCHLTLHAKEDSIPLRLGRYLSGDRVYLEDIEEDEDGTNGQKPNEIDRGNWHALADLWLEAVGGESLGRWRFVLGRPHEDWQDAPVVTVLPVNRDSIKSEGALSLLLQRERKSGKHAWLTPIYVAEVLHDLYRNERLRHVEDLSEHIRERDKAPLIEKHQNALRENAELHAQNTELQDNLRVKDSEILQLRSALQGLPVSTAEPSSEQVGSVAEEPGKQVTDIWPSRKPNSPYHNVGLEATVKRVERLGERIRLTYTDTKGKPRDVTDFGYEGFVEPVFEYLKSRKDQRAVFILTWKDDKVLRLASDTMLLPQYASLWNL